MRPMRSYADARTLTTVALLVAVGAVLGLVESSIIPALPVPGVRLGLGNLAVVLALSLVGRAAALRVSALRVVIVAVATGALGGPGFAMAVAGALASWAVMSLLSRLRGVSAIGWSVGGAAAHVLAQLFVASWIAGSAAPLLLSPIALALAVSCGLVIGYSSRLLLSRLPLMRSELGTH